MGALLVRKETGEIMRESAARKSVDYLNQQAGKIRENADVIVQQGKKLLACKRSDSAGDSREGFIGAALRKKINFTNTRSAKMNMTGLSSILVGATLALVWQTSVAAGAAELARDANASLQQLYASVPAAKALGAKAQAILVFPEGHQGRPRRRRSVWRRCAAPEGQGRRVLQHRGRVGRASGRRPAIRLCDVLHERQRAGAARQGRRVRGRGRSDRGRDGRGQGEDDDDHDREGRHLCLHLRPEGADGRARHTGQQDHQDHSEIGRAKIKAHESGLPSRTDPLCICLTGVSSRG